MHFVDWVVKTTGKISDNFNQHKFYVKSQPEIIDSSSVVSVNTYVSRDMNATVPCSFKWSKIRNGITTQIPQFRGNTYMCQPSDVGCHLQAEITSSDPQHSGTAILKLGPVKFDVLLKKEIQIALNTGQSNFLLDLLHQNEIKQCQLKINQQKISLHHVSSETSYTFPYCMVQPKIQSLPKIHNKLNILFNQKYYQGLKLFLIKLFGQQHLSDQFLRNPYLQLSFSNRKSKDSFIFITKAFSTKRQLKSSTIINRLQKTDLAQKESFNFIYQNQSLRADIRKLLEINGKNYMEKRIYVEENKKLQKEIQEIISSYTKIIEEKFRGKQQFEKSFAVLRDKKEEINETKLHKLQRQNIQLKQKLSRLNNNNQSPFKKKLYCAEDQPFEIILNNLNDSLQEENCIQNLQTKQLQNKLNQSFQRIQQLQTIVKKYQKMNKSSINIYGQTQNKDIDNHQKAISARTKQTALQISVHVLHKQKEQLEKKYNNLKKKYEKVYAQKLNTNIDNHQPSPLDYLEAKSVKSIKSKKPVTNIHQNVQDVTESLVLSKDSTIMMNPQLLKFTASTNQVTNLKQENKTLKAQVYFLQNQLQQRNLQYTALQSKYKKKVSQLTEQLQLYRRNNDILNRSQHLSMEMDSYNEEQNNTLKNQNKFLQSENQQLSKLCEKYKAQGMRYKRLKKQLDEKGIVIDAVM